MLLDEFVEVRVNSMTVKYYESLGYEIPMKKASPKTFKKTGKEYVYDKSKTFMVKVNDLPKYSTIRVNVLCDKCKQNTMSVVYENYLSVMEKTGTYVCKDCAYEKVKETVQGRYNVDYVAQLESFKTKCKNTMIRKYNVEHALQHEDFKNKAKETMIRKYGVSHALQSPEFREKVNATLCNNGIRKTSIQQLYLHELYGGKMNYPIKYYASDICFIEEKLIIEYDGGGHFLSCTLGVLTEEEFKQKEIIRNSVIKREGYKQMRIISSKDYLPSDKILLQMLEHSRKYFSDYPEHSWIEFNIDTSTVRNAEREDGVFFDFGNLRKIKKADLVDQKDSLSA